MKLLIAVIITLLCAPITGCSSKPVVTSNDVEAVLQTSVVASTAKFGSDHCVIKSLADVFPPLFENDRSAEWTHIGSINFRSLDSPKLNMLPPNIPTKNRFTLRRFGCDRTIEITKPMFAEVEEKGERHVLAFITVNRLCGPNCGERFDINFTKKSKNWELDPEAFRKATLAY